MKTLGNVACGQTATVKRLYGDGTVKHGIMDMRIAKGTEIYVRKAVLLRDPIEVTVGGCELSIRKSEAKKSRWSLFFAW